MDSQTNSILTALYSKANPKNVEGMARYGIKSTNNVLGLTSNDLFSLAKNIGTKSSACARALANPEFMRREYSRPSSQIQSS